MNEVEWSSLSTPPSDFLCLAAVLAVPCVCVDPRLAVSAERRTSLRSHHLLFVFTAILTCLYEPGCFQPALYCSSYCQRFHWRQHQQLHRIIFWLQLAKRLHVSDLSCLSPTLATFLCPADKASKPLLGPPGLPALFVLPEPVRLWKQRFSEIVLALCVFIFFRLFFICLGTDDR